MILNDLASAILKMEYDLTSKRKDIFEFIAVLAILIFIVWLGLYHGINRNFLANSDMDVVSAYLAILVASGEPLEHYPHTGYLQALIYGTVIRVADVLGWIPSSQLQSMLVPANFETYFARVIFVGRGLSIAYAIGCSVVVWRIVRILTGDRFTSVFALALFSGSLGLGDQILVIRTELPSMLFILSAFFILLRASRETGLYAVACLGVAAFFAYAALLVKIQVVFILLFFPIAGLALAGFGQQSPSRLSLKVNICTCLFSAGLIVSAGIMLIPTLPPGQYGIYQWLILVYVFLAIYMFTRFKNMSLSWFVVSSFVFLMGLSAAQLLNYIKVSNTGYAAFNFLEALSQYGGNSGEDSTVQNIISLPGHFIDFFTRYLLPQKVITDTYPMMLLYWISIVGTFIALIKRWPSHQLVMASLLIAVAIILPTVFSIRGYFYQYRIYVEIWLIVSATIFLVELTKNKRYRTLTQGTMIILVIFIPFTQIGFNLMKPSAANTREPIIVCPMMMHVPRISHLLLPFCNEARRAKGINDLISPPVPYWTKLDFEWEEFS